MGKFTLRKFPTHDGNGNPIRNCAVDYVGYSVTNLFDLINDHSSAKEIERVQCSYIYLNEKQCITLLNSSSIKNGRGRCNLHQGEVTNE